MTIVRYDPFGSLNKLHNELNRLFQESQSTDDDQSQVVTGAWSPAVDIKEQADCYVITADVPGVDPKEIEVTLEEGVLSLKGERSTHEDTERPGFKRIERAHGTFYRRFSLPDGVDTTQVKAHSAHGVLTIEVPKRARPEPRRIDIASSETPVSA